MRGSFVLRFDYLGYPAACRGHKADGVSKGEKRQLFPLVDHGVSNLVVDIFDYVPALIPKSRRALRLKICSL